MKKVHQNKHNNCLSACVASFLEKDIDEVPIFVKEENWAASLEKYLEKRGYRADVVGYAPRGYSIMIVRVPSVGKAHAVISKDGQVWHDPAKKGKITQKDLDGYRMDYFIVIREWN